MKKRIFNTGLLFILVAVLTGCFEEKCETTFEYTAYRPVYVKSEDFRGEVKAGPPKPLERPGKIYYFDGYLYINEYKKGIHIIDNRDPANPVHLAFVAISGNVDMAVRGRYLYADNYVDLVVLDVANPGQPQLLGRSEGVFPAHNYHPERGFLVDYEARDTVLTRPCTLWRPGDGEWGFPERGAFLTSDVSVSTNAANSGANQSVSSSGIGGSLARFTIQNDYLYTVDQSTLRVFNLRMPTEPQMTREVALGWNIETIFPYEDKLFLGSNDGMHIYSTENPELPTRLAVFSHATACDPVYVHNDTAYVTLRDGVSCSNADNQLDVVDVNNPRAPRLLKSYPMHHPIGLSVDDAVLMICEDEQGLKLFDKSDWRSIDKNLLAHLTGFTTYDVISLSRQDIALVIGSDGLHQFDYSDPRNPRQLSVLPVVR